MEGWYSSILPARKHGRVARLVEKLDYQTPTPRKHSFYRNPLRNNAGTTNYTERTKQDKIISSFFANLHQDLYNHQQKVKSQPASIVQQNPRRSREINPDAALYNYMKSQNLFVPPRENKTTVIPTGKAPDTKSTPQVKNGLNRRVRFADAPTNISSPKAQSLIQLQRTASEKLTRVKRQNLLQEIKMCRGVPSNSYLTYGRKACA